MGINPVYLGILDLPSNQDASHHQDFFMFSNGPQPKPSFANGQLDGVARSNLYQPTRCVFSLCARVLTPYLGDGHPTFDKEYSNPYMT